MSNAAIPPSSRLRPIPDIDPLRNIEVTPPTHSNKFTGWADLFASNRDVWDYLLKPGDYSTWGTLTIPHQGGHFARPKTIRYHDPEVPQPPHPVNQPVERRVRIRSFKVASNAAKDWLLQGLSSDGDRLPQDPGGGTESQVQEGPRNIVIDYCLFERHGRYSLRIREATDVSVQRCVIRNSIPLIVNDKVPDTTGVYVGGVRRHVRGIDILDNEIYNIGDGIQISDSNTEIMDWHYSVCIEGNDIYLDPSRYIEDMPLRVGENAIDVKQGSPEPASTVIRGNRLWGYRVQPGSARGELLVIQHASRNVLVEDNIFGDAPYGMKDESWPKLAGEPKTNPRYVLFRRNQFHDISDQTSTFGAVTKPVTSCIAFEQNNFARCGYLVDRTPDGGFLGIGPVYRGNTLSEIGLTQRPPGPGHSPDPSPAFELPPDNVHIDPPPRSYAQYTRRRWTGPESAIGAIPLA